MDKRKLCSQKFIKLFYSWERKLVEAIVHQCTIYFPFASVPFRDMYCHITILSYFHAYLVFYHDMANHNLVLAFEVRWEFLFLFSVRWKKFTDISCDIFNSLTFSRESFSVCVMLITFCAALVKTQLPCLGFERYAGSQGHVF